MEQEPISSPEVIPIENLPERLGFIESPELQLLREAVVEAMRSGKHSDIKDQLSNYQQIAEKIVEQLEGHDYDKAQIGLIVATGLLWRTAGQDSSYANELRNARRYAGNMGYVEVAQALDVAFAEVEEAHRASQEAPYTGPTVEEIITGCKKELPPELHEELDLLYDLPAEEVLEQVAAFIYGADDYGAESEEPYDFFERMGWIEPQTDTRGQ